MVKNKNPDKCQVVDNRDSNGKFISKVDQQWDRQELVWRTEKAASGESGHHAWLQSEAAAVREEKAHEKAKARAKARRAKPLSFSPFKGLK